MDTVHSGQASTSLHRGEVGGGWRGGETCRTSMCWQRAGKRKAEAEKRWTDQETSKFASGFQWLKWREYENHCHKPSILTANAAALNLGCTWSLIRHFCCWIRKVISRYIDNMRSYKSVGDLSHHLYTKVTVPLKCLTILGNWQCCKTVLLKDQPNPNTASLSLSVFSSKSRYRKRSERKW